MRRYLWPESIDAPAAAALAEVRDLAAIWGEQGGGRRLGAGYYVPIEEVWPEANDVLGLTAKQRKVFTAAERATLGEVQTWIDDQVALYKRKIERKKKKSAALRRAFTAKDVEAENRRLRTLAALESRLSAALKAGRQHKSALLILARVIHNEAGVANTEAKRAIAYAYLNMVGKTRAPTGAEISGYQSLSDYWSGLPDDTARLVALKSYAACLEVADDRLDDATPSTSDPTKGATRWVSPVGLKSFDATRDAAKYYSRTYQGLKDRRFPKWARDPADPEVAVMQKAGSLRSNYDEFAVSGVPNTQFLFYVGVK